MATEDPRPDEFRESLERNRRFWKNLLWVVIALAFVYILANGGPFT